MKKIIILGALAFMTFAFSFEQGKSKGGDKHAEKGHTEMKSSPDQGHKNDHKKGHKGGDVKVNVNIGPQKGKGDKGNIKISTKGKGGVKIQIKDQGHGSDYKSKGHDSDHKNKGKGSDYKHKSNNGNGHAYGHYKKGENGKKYGHYHAFEVRTEMKKMKYRRDAIVLIEISRQQTFTLLDAIQIKMNNTRSLLNLRLSAGTITQVRYDACSKDLRNFEKRRNSISVVIH